MPHHQKHTCIHAGQCQQNLHTALPATHASSLAFEESPIIKTLQDKSLERKHEPIPYIASFSIQQQANARICPGQQPVTRMRPFAGALVALYQATKCENGLHDLECSVSQSSPLHDRDNLLAQLNYQAEQSMKEKYNNNTYVRCKPAIATPP